MTRRQRPSKKGRAMASSTQIAIEIAADDEEGCMHVELSEEFEKARQAALEYDPELIFRWRSDIVNRVIARDVIEIDADQSCSRGYLLTPVVLLQPAG
jgi:hypothetical protein